MKLHRPLRTLAAASLLLGVGAVATTSFAGASSAKDLAPTGHALFVETDAPGGNSVLSYTRGTDGTVPRTKSGPPVLGSLSPAS